MWPFHGIAFTNLKTEQLKRTLPMYSLKTIDLLYRRAGSAEHPGVRLLSRALPRHHLQDQDPAEDALLLLQPYCALYPDRLHGRPRLHAPAGLGRKTFIRLAVIRLRIYWSLF